MRKRLSILAAVYLVCLACVLALFHTPIEATVDLAALNDTAMTAKDENWDAKRIAAELDRAYDEMAAQKQARNLGLEAGVIVLLTVFCGALAVALVRIERRMIRPFRQMESFAQQVASGNLDVPLAVDKENSFGAFTESFDLMRTELARAREAEQRANASKKELIASLSHDIKTPVASIRATSELMAATARNDKQRSQAETIVAKADQVICLVDNLFDSTMRELQELAVHPQELPSRDIVALLSKADYEKAVVFGDVPDCLIYADPNRLQQVFDNILANSYKYAETDIAVSASLEDDMLVVDIDDHGAGVADNELPLLTNKFFRGKNAQGKKGFGLGLYNAASFMEGMQGGLECFNKPGGFTVRLMFTLV